MLKKNKAEERDKEGGGRGICGVAGQELSNKVTFEQTPEAVR